MSIKKTWDFEKVIASATDAVAAIPADNIGSPASLPAQLTEKGYDFVPQSKLTGTYSGVTWGSQKFTVQWKLQPAGGVPASMLKAVTTDTVRSQFQQLLKANGLTKNNFEGKIISARTIQAIVQTVMIFIRARFVIYVDPSGETSLQLYDQGDVEYSSIGNYDYQITDAASKFTVDNFNTVMGRAVASSVYNIRIRKEDFAVTYTCTSSSSSCSSSSSSSSSCSSCSSSCSSSSCSSSCSSSIFIAYMNLGR